MTALETFHALCETMDPTAAAQLTLAQVIERENKTANLPLTVAQTARRLNISARKVYELCEKGLLRHTANPIRIMPTDLEAYRATQRGRSKAALRHLR